ncbi:MAG: DUF89 domain-containing protein [Promethearchaeota archaeon]
MKIQSQCLSCLVSRGYKNTILSTDDRGLQLQAMKEFISLLADHFRFKKEIPSPEVIDVPAYLGTERERLIQRISDNFDPHYDFKVASNTLSAGLATTLDNEVETKTSNDSLEALEMVAQFASAANAIEFGVEGFDFSLDDLSDILQSTVKDIALWDFDKFLHDLETVNHILYFTDNCGEIYFDRLFVKRLAQIGKEVVVAGKDSPIANDATVQNLIEAGFPQIPNVRVCSIGTNSMGLFFHEISSEFEIELNSADLLLFKGMAYYETVPEYSWNKPVYLMFRAKCQPVANTIQVRLGSNVFLKLNENY